MNVIESQFEAVYDSELDDYVISIPKVECEGPEDGQTKIFGDTGGFFCGFRAGGGFNFPILHFTGDRQTIKPAALLRKIVSGTKPLYAHCMILDRGGPVWEDTKVCHDLFVTEMTAAEAANLLRQLPTFIMRSWRIVESEMVLEPPETWGDDYSVPAQGGGE